MFATYDWARGREAMMCLGADDAPIVALALPPFEEANRTRTFAVGMLRELADRGVASILPDLPGTGESHVPTAEASLTDWRAAFAAACAAAGASHALSIRAGAMIDADAPVSRRWRFAPQPGAALVRELVRTRQANAREEGTTFDPAEIDIDGPPIAIAGYDLPRAFLRELRAGDIRDAGDVRIVRLETDAQPADIKLPGSPLWRRAEPGDERSLAVALADDIAQWIARCAG